MSDLMFRWLCILILINSAAVSAAESDPPVCKPVYEIHAQWQNLRLRAHENDFMSCQISRVTFNDLVEQAMTDTQSQSIHFQSAFLGRLIDYPWLAQKLAQHASAHPDWDSNTGQPRAGNINALVAEILSDPEILELVQQPFTIHGYQVTGVSVEKVLVDVAGNQAWLEITPEMRVPYDAMVHLRLQQPGTH